MTDRATVLATQEQVGQAHEMMVSRGDPRRFFVEADGGLVEIPAELSAILHDVLASLARGGAVSVSAMPELLTTTQAADLLGESRPTLMKRIRAGELESAMVGTHHRVHAADVLELRDRLHAERRARALEFLELEDAAGL